MVDWRARYEAGGIAALQDSRERSAAGIDEIDVVVATLADDGRPPADLGVTHWSSRLLGAELGISFAAMARIWRDWELQPGGSRRSSSPPTRSWTRRSATWSACI